MTATREMAAFLRGALPMPSQGVIDLDDVSTFSVVKEGKTLVVTVAEMRPDDRRISLSGRPAPVKGRELRIEE